MWLGILNSDAFELSLDLSQNTIDNFKLFSKNLERHCALLVGIDLATIMAWSIDTEQ